MAQEARHKITVDDLKKASSNQKVKLTAQTYTFAEDTFAVYNIQQTIRTETHNVAVIPMKGNNGKVQDVPLRYFCTRSYIDNTNNKELKEIEAFCPINDLVEAYEMLEKAFSEKLTFKVSLQTYTGMFDDRPYATFIQSLVKSE